jgi:Icc-related predicted phosphoesterase
MATLKILLLSDTHGYHHHPRFQTTQPYDVLIHAGDFTNTGNQTEVDDFLEWIEQQNHFKDIIYIAGNHDIGYTSRAVTELENGTRLHYLHNDSTCIDGFNFYGSPYTPRFFDWAFMYDPHEANAIWSKIPHDTDVLISHGPPHGIMDECADLSGNPTNAGCPVLLNYVERTPSIKLHVFGHIHEGHGVATHANGRVSVNAASICGSDRHQPIEFELTR